MARLWWQTGSVLLEWNMSSGEYLRLCGQGGFRRGGRGFQEGEGKVQSHSSQCKGADGLGDCVGAPPEAMTWEFSHPLAREQGVWRDILKPKLPALRAS